MSASSAEDHLCQHPGHQSLVHREVVQRRQVRPPHHNVEHLLKYLPEGMLAAREAEVQQASQQKHVQPLVVLPVWQSIRANRANQNQPHMLVREPESERADVAAIEPWR